MWLGDVYQDLWRHHRHPALHEYPHVYEDISLYCTAATMGRIQLPIIVVTLAHRFGLYGFSLGSGAVDLGMCNCHQVGQ